ncbi:hypothetical protein Tco_0362204, partial [Tanacetum coccineum]
PPSPDYIPGPEDPQAHDPDYVPEPIYLKYIPLEDEHVFLAEEQPLPLINSPTAMSPGYVADSDLEEDPEEDPKEDPEEDSEEEHADYPADGGDDDDDDTDDEDEEPFEEEEEEHLAPADLLMYLFLQQRIQSTYTIAT